MIPQSLIVTGAAGFIGSHLARALLRRGHWVVGIDNFDPFYSRSLKARNVEEIVALKDSAFEMIELDIKERDRLGNLFLRVKPECIFHLAALAGVRPSIADPARYASVNVDGLVSVLEAARASGCRNIIFASSSSVYGNNSKVPFAETDAVDEPISPYAATKRAGELICHTYARLFNMRIIALRFFTVFGPGQRPDLAISKFMRLIAAGEEVPMYGDGSSSRDYTYIDDVIQGVLAAHDLLCCPSEPARPRAGDLALGGLFRIYNLGSDHPISLAKMIESISQVVGKPARIKRLPMQAGDVEQTWANLAQSRNELNYTPQTAFETGLAKQFQAFRNDARVH